MSNEKQRKTLVQDIWSFIKERGANKTGYPDIDIRLSDIKESVFLLEDELRISGEQPNNFSEFYVDYYVERRWQELLTHLSEKGWMAEWFNPGYIIAYEEEGVNA